eukprot:3795997-Amphidinium_carterae.1
MYLGHAAATASMAMSHSWQSAMDVQKCLQYKVWQPCRRDFMNCLQTSCVTNLHSHAFIFLDSVPRPQAQSRNVAMCGE